LFSLIWIAVNAALFVLAAVSIIIFMIRYRNALFVFIVLLIGYLLYQNGIHGFSPLRVIILGIDKFLPVFLFMAVIAIVTVLFFSFGKRFFLGHKLQNAGRLSSVRREKHDAEKQVRFFAFIKPNMKISV
jgi:hypothetical protein